MSAPPTKSRSEEKREREVLQYVAAYQDLPRLEELAAGPGSSYLPPSYNAQHSTDSTLIALCQLAALRMNAQRALVSLIDGHRQHVLVEATPRTSLRSSHPKGDGTNELWLGSVSIPRSWGVCEQVLDLDTADAPKGKGSSVIINEDLLHSSQHAHRTYVQDGTVRFYTGAALIGYKGAIVGALCVFDDKPRLGGVPAEDVMYLEDLAATVIEYLGTYMVKDKFRRGEKLTRGLISFAEGASALLPLGNTIPYAPTSTTPSSLASTAETVPLHDANVQNHQLPSAETNDATSQTSQAGSLRSTQGPDWQKKQQVSAQSDRPRPGSTRQTSLRALQDTILPTDSRSMFARAANVMLASSDLEGVLIFDASVAATGHRQHPAAPEHEKSGGSPSDSADPESKSELSEDSSSHSGSANHGPTSSSHKRCQILGAAPPRPMVRSDGTSGTGSLLETSLARLLQDYPHGKVFNYSAGGSILSSTDSSSSNKDLPEKALDDTQGHPRAQRKRSHSSRSSKAISDLLPNARSVAFVPFWDYERSRWFAGCLCWTNNPDRLLSVSVDLPYFNIFSHSIMRELSRLDALMSNQQKLTFVASISHELRSPLHGILGTLEFLKDTQLNTFQISMLNSLDSCGQTLLDTINHLMDHSKMSESSRNVSSKRLKDTNTVRLSSKPLKVRRLPHDPAFDLGIATEEVVEAVFAGSSFLPIMNSKQALLLSTESTSSASSSTEGTDPTTKRKTCYIVLDVAPEQDWLYCFPLGSWKRAVMNLFGNAVKYTHTGHVTVSLHATETNKSTGPATTITLTVTDTGAGMSPSFLANKAFQPFSQENPHSSGVGLGLSIVRQIIEARGGKIEVSSDHFTGTKVTIKLSLEKPEVHPPAIARRTEYLSCLSRLQGRRVCLLHRPATDQDIRDEPQNAEGLAKFTRALTSTLSDHLKMEVVQSTKWQDNNIDLVICPEPSFDYLTSIRDGRVVANAEKAPVTIFVALDALEAATLRSDVRVQSKESVVEIMTQPLGPFKLAFVLDKCLERFERADENVPRPFTTPILGGPQVGSPLSDQSTPYSPAPAEMPPLLNQPFWHQTDKFDAAAATEGLRISRPPLKPPTVREFVLPVNSNFATPGTTRREPSRILITDDNVINRKLLVAFMKKNNLDYIEAENGLEALRTYQSTPAQIDVILMDMSMPVMDGVSATRAIRQYEQEYKIPRCYIMALTGLASASARLEAWNAGIDNFMTKPVNFNALGKSLLKAKEKHEKSKDTTRASETPLESSSQSES